MPTDAEWSQKITAVTASRPVPVIAQTFLGLLPGFSRAVKLSCSDGQTYVVKGRQIGRAIVNEHIVGSLGRALGAPVGEINLVEVLAAFIAIEPQIRHLSPGIAHGSVFDATYSEKMGLAHMTVLENRERFARLSVLFSWMGAGDHQFFYEKSPPNRVASFDHGHFFGQNWTEASITALPPPQPDPVFQVCALTAQELQEAVARLQQISDDDIARAVGVPPDDWGVSMQERIAMANYLWNRKSQLFQNLSAAA
jgi:HipA-like protein